MTLTLNVCRKLQLLSKHKTLQARGHARAKQASSLVVGLCWLSNSILPKEEGARPPVHGLRGRRRCSRPMLAKLAAALLLTYASGQPTGTYANDMPQCTIESCSG